MNQITQLKIQDNAEFIFDFIDFMVANPDKLWIYQLLDQPFQLAIRVAEMGIDEDPFRISRQLGCSWQTVKQIQQALNKG